MLAATAAATAAAAAMASQPAHMGSLCTDRWWRRLAITRPRGYAVPLSTSSQPFPWGAPAWWVMASHTPGYVALGEDQGVRVMQQGHPHG